MLDGSSGIAAIVFSVSIGVQVGVCSLSLLLVMIASTPCRFTTHRNPHPTNDFLLHLLGIRRVFTLCQAALSSTAPKRMALRPHSPRHYSQQYIISFLNLSSLSSSSPLLQQQQCLCLQPTFHCGTLLRSSNQCLIFTGTLPPPPPPKNPPQTFSPKRPPALATCFTAITTSPYISGISPSPSSLTSP